MRSFLFVLFALAWGAISSPIVAQTPQWTGIIAPTRATDWSKAGVQSGIQARTTNCASIAPMGSASTPAAPTAINNAIASCPAGQVVFLQAGNFYLNSGIDFANHSNVTLRGAGANQTFLYFTGNTGCFGLYATICIENDGETYSGGWADHANWTGGYAPGTTTLTLSVTQTNAATLTPGKIIVLDQCNTGLSGNASGFGGTSNPGCTSGTEADNGNLFVCDIQGTCNTGSPTGNYRTNRAQSEVHIITAVSPTGAGPGTYTVTLDRGIELPNWSSGSSPGAWWPDKSVTGDGIENLSLDNGVSSGASHSIGIIWASNSWVTGVRSVRGHNSHVEIFTSCHITIASNYFYGTVNPGSGAYGIAETQSSDDLFVNNIMQGITAPDAADGPVSGSVYGYNFATNDAYYNPNYLLASDEPHSAGDMFDLYEGNQGLSFNADDIHGTEDMQTLFRNWYSGQATGAITSGAQPVQFYSYQRYGNVIGNVLGYNSSQTGTYQLVAPTGSNNPQVGGGNPIYFIGWFGYNGADPLVLPSLFRWGNYDVATGTTRWCGSSSTPGCGASEVPSSLSIYSNPVPSTTTLPASFFLSAKPSWWSTPWGTPSWPPIGPDVTGGTGPGGHVSNIPSALCFANSPADQSYPLSSANQPVLSFNAGTCYGNQTQSQTAPQPPTGVIATVQ